MELDAIRPRVIKCNGDLEAGQSEPGGQMVCEKNLVCAEVERRVVSGEQVCSEVDSDLDSIPSKVREEVMELRKKWCEIRCKDRKERYNFRGVNRHHLIEVTKKVNELVKYIETKDITETKVGQYTGI